MDNCFYKVEITKGKRNWIERWGYYPYSMVTKGVKELYEGIDPADAVELEMITEKQFNNAPNPNLTNKEIEIMYPKRGDYTVTVWKKDYGEWPFMLAKNTEEWGNFSKYDVEDAVENYYELGADKVVAKKAKKVLNIIWPDDPIIVKPKKKKKKVKKFTKLVGEVDDAMINWSKQEIFQCK